MDLITRLLESPYAKKIEQEAEAERLAGRRECRIQIETAERKYDAVRGKLDPEIETAKSAVGEFTKMLEAARQELTRLSFQKRFAYTDRDREVKIQEDRLKKTCHPCLEPSMNKCRQKIEKVRRGFVSGERKDKGNIWGIVSHEAWSNGRAINDRIEIIKKAIERLEGMKLGVIENEPMEVRRVLDSIPKDPLGTDHDEWDFNPEAWRLEVAGKLRPATRG